MSMRMNGLKERLDNTAGTIHYKTRHLLRLASIQCIITYTIHFRT